MWRLGLLAFVVVGCITPGTRRPAAVPRPVEVGSGVAVVPFRTGGSLSNAGEFILGGGSLPGVEDGAKAARALAAALGRAGVTVRDADVVAGVAQRVDTGSYGVAFARRVAERAGAGVVVIGTLVRFVQRDGTAWGVRSPASVEYQAALVRASDGTVLLLDRFAYTQQPLSENLLALPRFLRGGGRWLTREEILDGALQETAEKMAGALRAAPIGEGRKRSGR